MWLHSLMTAQEIDNPPELFYVMKSIADFGKKWDEQTPITELAKQTKDKIFYDNYPLSEYVDKDDFEIDILNHFIHNRINFDTVTSFKIALINKLREIMPKYNSMFDLKALELDLFYTNHEKDITETTDDDFINHGNKSSEENGQYRKTGTEDITDTGTTGKEGENTSSGSETGSLTRNTKGKRKEDLRESDTPQNALADVKNGSYVSNYKYNEIDTEEDVTEGTTKTTTGRGTFSESGDSRDVRDRDWTEQGTDKTEYEEGTVDTGERDIKHIYNETYLTKDNLVAKMKEYNTIEPIMTMIYRDLDCLFLQVYDF